MASRDYEYQGIRIEGIRELRSAFETAGVEVTEDFKFIHKDVAETVVSSCLLYTSDAADE